MNKKKLTYLIEQTDWTELTDDENKLVKSWSDARVISYFSQKTPPITVKKVKTPFGNIIWKKRETSSAPPPPSTNNAVYIGKYKGSGMLPNFEIKEKEEKLVAEASNMYLELINETGTTFKTTWNGLSANVEFNVSDNRATGGKVIFGSNSIEFTRDDSAETSVLPIPPNFQDGQWVEIAKSTYERLQKLGEWVGKKAEATGMKFYRWMTRDQRVVAEGFDCIDNHNKSMSLRMLKVSPDGKTAEERFVKEVDGQRTKLIYTIDGIAKWVFRDTDEVILEGKWKCTADDSYMIQFNDGQKLYFGDKGPENETDITRQPGPRKTCNSYKTTCPTEEQILAKKGKLQVCMKCSLIKQIQDYEFIKTLLSNVQLSYGLPQATSDEFTYEFKAAVEKFQRQNSLVDDGIIGMKTMALIKKMAEDETTMKNKAKEQENLKQQNTGQTNQNKKTTPATKIVLNPSIYNKKDIPVSKFDDDL